MSKKSKFDLSHERKLSLNMGDLVPILCQEVLPGDRIRNQTELMMRLAPMLAPVMHRVNVFVHNWYVPNRLVWNQWQDFITGGKEGDLAPVIPNVLLPYGPNLSLTLNGSLADYMGLPTNNGGTVTNQYQISALAFRAYQLIYNECYRDQNLSDPIPFSLGGGTLSGPDTEACLTIRKRAWEKDYFTSALPWAQRGGAAAAPVDYEPGVPSRLVNTVTGAPLGSQLEYQSTVGGDLSTQPANATARLETDASVDVQEMRKAFRVQEWLEKNARGGARYIEVLLKHFGVMSSDARLQRPEFLGGASSPVVISEVLSTFQFSGDAVGQPQGNMSGHGISTSSGNGFSRRFEEHGHVITILSVVPRTCYQQGINRSWRRFDKFDYAWPTFANLGEQEVKDSEVYAEYEAAANTPDGTFGYQERYGEYKYGFNTVHGDFRDSLAYWHEGRIFPGKPSLNEQFVMSDPSHRIFAVTDPTIHKLYAQVYHSMSAIRPLPFFGIPKV